MSSSHSLRLSPEAEDDIQDIVQFTIEWWDVDAGARYSEAIWSALQRLTRFPEIGTDLSGSLSGIRKLPVRSHLIYYTVDHEEVGVVGLRY